jgi:hypothetical protein
MQGFCDFLLVVSCNDVRLGSVITAGRVVFGRFPGRANCGLVRFGNLP